MPINNSIDTDEITRAYTAKSREQIESFIEDVLRRNLREYETYINKMNAEIMEFIQLKNVCENITQNMSDGFKTQVNIGGNFFISAKVPDSKKIMINIGLNHYVEFTIVEAIKFCDFKIKSQQNEANVIREKSIETRAQIKLALLCIAEKENLLKATWIHNSMKSNACASVSSILRFRTRIACEQEKCWAVN